MHAPSFVGLGPTLITRTEGNPFFLEETVQSLIEMGALTGRRESASLSSGGWPRFASVCVTGQCRGLGLAMLAPAAGSRVVPPGLTHE